MLVAAPERWDEACFMLPALRAVLATGLKTGVICHPLQRPLWETVGGAEVIDLPGKTREAVGAIRGGWQAAILWEAGRTADVVAKAAIPRRLGPAPDKKLRKRLTHPLPSAPGPLEHRVRYYLTAVEEMGIATDRPEFFAPAELSCDTIPKTVILSPESDFGPSHEWPLDRWLEIGRAMVDDEMRITVAATRDGRAAGKLASGLGQGVEFLDASDPGGILPWLAIHSLAVAADGSLPHLAAHAGVTCVTLFGPNDPQWKRPLGKRHVVLRRHVECAPCLLPKCPLDLRCQHELETAQVLKTMRETRAGMQRV